MYGSISNIKYRLKIDQDETDYDAQMTLSLNEATRIIESKLGYYTSSIPSSTDVYLGDIAEDYGASIFRSRIIPANTRILDNDLEPDILKESGDSKILDYIKNNYMRGTFSFIGTSTIDTTQYTIQVE